MKCTTSLRENAIRKREHCRRMVYTSESMKEVIQQAQKVAQYEIDVLLKGESGTGKELIAAFIHAHGKRKKKPYITFCSS